MDSGKYRQYTNGLVIGAVGVSMVVGEQHPHIYQHGPVWPEIGYGAQAAITSAS
jgi:hypothetical protein